MLKAFLVAKKETWKALIDCLCHSSYIRKVLANMLRSLKQEISLQQEQQTWNQYPKNNKIEQNFTLLKEQRHKVIFSAKVAKQLAGLANVCDSLQCWTYIILK